MSSGEFPLHAYHRAQSLGSGSYGDVLTVHNDDGQEFAIKLFISEDDDDEEDGDDFEESNTSSSNKNNDDDTIPPTIDLGALREISILRLLRCANSHPNIIEISDLKPKDELIEDNEYTKNDEQMCHLGIIMPVYSNGNLSDAINSNLIAKKISKIKIAHGILNAVAYLHSNGIIHRDIKGDNIMLDYDKNTGEFIPIVIDFSLAKVIQPQKMFIQEETSSLISHLISQNIENETTHTQTIGTPTYKAPEVVSNGPYHLPSDIYSVGVVLLELLRGKTLEATKDKEAINMITDIVKDLPEQPFAHLIRGLLEINPDKRLTAIEALNSPVFTKFGIDINEKSLQKINIAESLPFDNEDDDNNDVEGQENISSNGNKNKSKHKKSSHNKTLQKRIKLVNRIIHELDSKNLLTTQAALCYAQQLSQLEDVDNLQESQALCDCVILAHNFFESEMWALSDINKLNSGIFREFDWCAESYADTQETILMLMDFCLYPRELINMTLK